jgi:hypoxanthine phosphoribosyltransferase
MPDAPPPAAESPVVAGEILIDGPAIARRVRELARDLRNEAGPDTPLHLVAVLKGAFLFLADFVRQIEGPVTCDFIALSSYGAGQSSSGEVRLTKDLDEPLEGRDVVIVEDIIDTGLTLSYLQTMLRGRGPRSLRTVTLLNKPSRRKAQVTVEHIGFDIPDRFVVGYGLDYDGLFRNLPYIAVLGGSAPIGKQDPV